MKASKKKVCGQSLRASTTNAKIEEKKTYIKKRYFERMEIGKGGKRLHLRYT